MIKRPDNWNEVKAFADRPRLPLGAYVCRVKKALVQSTDYGDRLCILFDIAEGDFEGHFTEEFKANQNPGKKYKGVLRQWLPRNDGSEKDEWTKSSFKGMVTAFEESNPGYVWNWEEASLAGKLVGIVFRNEEWEYNGKHGWAVRPFRASAAGSVRSGEFTLPKDKPLKSKSGYTAPQLDDMGAGYGEGNPFEGSYRQSSFADEDDGQLPF